jgi:hypothetical protein
VSRPATLIAALGAWVALMLGLILGNFASAGDTQKRPATWMTVRGLTDKATLTSICGADSNGGDFCAVTDDRFVGRLPVRPRDLVGVRTRPAAGRVKAYLLRLRPNGDIAEWLDWSRRARKVEGSRGRRWRFRLPGRAGRRERNPPLPALSGRRFVSRWRHRLPGDVHVASRARLKAVRAVGVMFSQ